MPIGLSARLVVVAAGCLVARLSPAQTPALPAPAPAAAPILAEPLYLLNDNVLMTSSCMQAIKPGEIEKIAIYKEQSTAPAQWRGLMPNGLISITLKRKAKLKSWSLTQLGQRLQLKGPVSYRVNGQPVATPAVRIAAEAIGAIQFSQEPAGMVMDVRLANRPVAPTPHPPGTIMIRGAAAYQPAR